MSSKDEDFKFVFKDSLRTRTRTRTTTLQIYYQTSKRTLLETQYIGLTGLVCEAFIALFLFNSVYKSTDVSIHYVPIIMFQFFFKFDTILNVFFLEITAISNF